MRARKDKRFNGLYLYKDILVLLVFMIVFFIFLVTARADIAKNNKKDSVVKNLFGKISLAIEGRSYEEGVNELNGTFFLIDGRFSYIVSPFLQFKVFGRLQYDSLNVQLRDKFNYSNKSIKIYDAVFDFKLTPQISLLGGSIGQARLGVPLLVSKRSFPGVAQKINWSSNLIDFKFISQQTIPTSVSFNSERSGKEETPYFFSERADFAFKFTESTRLNLWAVHYLYTSLPSIVALKSSALGNSVNGSLNNSSFATGFNGGILAAQFDFPVYKDWKASLSHQVLNNFKAKSNNRGQTTQLNLIKNFQDKIKVKFTYENFFKDRDVVPALYAEPKYSGNNRTGHACHLSLDFLPSKFRIQTGYYDNNIISEAPHQKDSMVVYISLSSDIAIF